MAAARDDLGRRSAVPGSQLDQWVAVARPRLLRLARSYGLAPDAADDAVQETLLEAWRHLDALTEPEGIIAWLNSICRNVCRRYARSQYRLGQRELRFDASPALEQDRGAHLLRLEDLADPQQIDPLEALDREDLATLLDRALGHLPPPARDAVELCYLAELPQQEAARRLRLTIRALEARLHRARKHLRQILSGPLRPEAQALGLALDEALPPGWQETRLWCPSCGRCRLCGTFERMPGDGINLRLRCPGCHHQLNSWGHVPLDELCSFRPAYKRVMRFTSTYFQSGLASGWLPCAVCGTRQPLRLVGPEALDALGESEEPSACRTGLFVVTACRACGRHHADSSVAALLWPRPIVQRFLAAHPRSIAEPETLVEHQGASGIRVRFTDLRSAARLTLFADPRTLALESTIQE